MDFATLPPEVQADIREKQRQKKVAKKRARGTDKEPPLPPVQLPNPRLSSAAQGGSHAEHRSRITAEEYFSACSGSFRDPNLAPTEENLEQLLSVLNAGTPQARRLGSCNYFQFSGSDSALWDPTFNARLAFEGFFTITSERRGKVEPLPELQPFYGVLTWQNFEASRHVRKALARLRRDGWRYRLADCVDPQRTWRLLNDYHCKKNGTNWLTLRYLAMCLQASRDASINFRLHCIELYEDGVVTANASGERELFQRKPLAGEIGFSIGRVYTSLSGWTEDQSSDKLGFAQLVLLGRWLRQRGYAFWSLGHCYSPEMEYKHELGHRVYPRADFLALLRRHRSAFRLSEARAPGAAMAAGAPPWPPALMTGEAGSDEDGLAVLRAIEDGESREAESLLNLAMAAPARSSA
mmetsp:Transcript_69493/g.192323  ORF Transcript_69493/g.192323 Transcript_69493/m.192323 type:complete len:409 (-) Transcript_69493:120-1346(-)